MFLNRVIHFPDSPSCIVVVDTSRDTLAPLGKPFSSPLTHASSPTVKVFPTKLSASGTEVCVNTFFFLVLSLWTHHVGQLSRILPTLPHSTLSLREDSILYFLIRPYLWSAVSSTWCAKKVWWLILWTSVFFGEQCCKSSSLLFAFLWEPRHMVQSKHLQQENGKTLPSKTRPSVMEVSQ